MTKKFKQIRYISTWSWCPHPQFMGASGTESAELEMHKWNDTSFKLNINSRLTTLAWGSENILAGGSEEGNLEIYDISKEDVVVFKKPNRMVKALDFSSIESSYLAHVGNQNDFCIWDLNQSSTALKSTKMMGISNVSWNSQVQHIIAACATNGYTVVWDLRTKREILSLYAPESSISSIAWHPNMGTQIMTASRNNQNPTLSLWDLRNVHTPEKVLSGHSQGILDISWCRQDPDRLISSDLDGRIHCYNPLQGQFLCELVHLPNPIQQVDFCPNNPDLFAARSSFLNLFSIQQKQQQPNLVRPSSMIRRPQSVSFGFGAKLVRCNGKKIHISTTIIDPDLKKRMQQLHTLSIDRLIELHQDEGDRDWDILKILNSVSAREDMIAYIKHNYYSKMITSKSNSRATPKCIKNDDDDPEIDALITRHVAEGDFEGAVKVCLRQDRFADALMLSMCGDSGLMARTQKLYLKMREEEQRYMMLTDGVMKQDLKKAVLTTEDVKRDWPVLLVALCTYATSEQFESLCDALGDRLSVVKDKQHALLFYLASGNRAKVTSLWLDSFTSIQEFIEKLTVFKTMTKEEDNDERLESVYNDYVDLLIDYGELEMALKYIQCVSNQGVKQQILYDRIYQAITSKKEASSHEFPFEKNSLTQLTEPLSNATTLRYYSAHQQPFA